MKWLTAILLLVCTTAVCGFGQGEPADTAARTITIPAPENGIIYIRSGEPGGVRIRSRRAPASRSREEPTPAAPVGARDVDLERLAEVFQRQGLNLYGERIRQGDRVIVVLRDSLSGAPADTLLPAEIEELVGSFGAAPLEEGLADAPPSHDALTDRVERSILDVGLFRSLQVNFEFDESRLLPSAFPTLNAVADVLQRYPALRLEVAGHTDAIGTDEYNQALSGRRAASVKAYLVGQGIDAGRVAATGYGEARPILSNETRTGRALNRRVEFRVLNNVDVEIRN